MSGSGRIGLLLGAVLILSLSAAAFGETLGDVLQQHGLPITAALHNREQSITSYAALDNDKVFVIGYYLDDGSGSLKEPLFVSRFDKGAREWKSSGILTRDLQGGGIQCFGSVTSVRGVQSSSSFLYLDTHINPSAGCVIVLSGDLAVRKVLYGWSLALFRDGRLVYHNSQIHFAPFEAAEISIYNPVRGIDLKIYPRKPYQRVRKEQIRQVRQVLNQDWCRRNNHPCDPELFDNRLGSPVEVEDSSSALAFVITYDNRRYGLTPAELEVLYVYRNVDNGRPLEYREVLLSDFKARFGDISLHERLQPAVLAKIFGH